MARLKVGSRAQVMHGTAKQTSGGLTKRQLKYNKHGKIVSRKASRAAKKSKNLIKAGYITRKGEFGAVKKQLGGTHLAKTYYKYGLKLNTFDKIKKEFIIWDANNKLQTLENFKQIWKKYCVYMGRDNAFNFFGTYKKYTTVTGLIPSGKGKQALCAILFYKDRGVKKSMQISLLNHLIRLGIPPVWNESKKDGRRFKLNETQKAIRLKLTGSTHNHETLKKIVSSNLKISELQNMYNKISEKYKKEYKNELDKALTEIQKNFNAYKKYTANPLEKQLDELKTKHTLMVSAIQKSHMENMRKQQQQQQQVQRPLVAKERGEYILSKREECPSYYAECTYCSKCFTGVYFLEEHLRTCPKKIEYEKS